MSGGINKILASHKSTRKFGEPQKGIPSRASKQIEEGVQTREIKISHKPGQAIKS